MDINGINDINKPKISLSNKVDRDNGFRQIFDQKITEIDAATVPTHSGSKADILEKSDQILNLLDNYTRELNDPTKTLKDIEPLVKRIEKEVNLIEVEVADKIQNDKEIEKIINDLTVTANVAAYKFHRGDYI